MAAARGIFYYIYVAGLVVTDTIGALGLYDIIIYARRHVFVAHLAVPAFGGIRGMKEFLAPLVEDVALKADQRFVAHLPFVVNSRRAFGRERIGNVELRLSDKDFVDRVFSRATSVVVVGVETDVCRSLFGESICKFKIVETVFEYIEFRIP